MRRLCVGLIGIFTIATLGCSEGADPTGPAGPATASLTISPDSIYLDGVGRQLHATATARDAAGNIVLAEVSWDVGDYDVATVSECGIILAFGEGATTVTARAGAVVDTAFLRVVFPDAAYFAGGRPVAATTDVEGLVTIETSDERALQFQISDQDGHPLRGTIVQYGELGGRPLVTLAGPTTTHVPTMLLGHADSVASALGSGQASPAAGAQAVVGFQELALSVGQMDRSRLGTMGPAYEIPDFYWGVEAGIPSQCLSYIEVADLMVAHAAIASGSPHVAVSFGSAAEGEGAVAVRSAAYVPRSSLRSVDRTDVAALVRDIGRLHYGVSSDGSIGPEKVRVRFGIPGINPVGALFDEQWATFLIVPNDPGCASVGQVIP